MATLYGVLGLLRSEVEGRIASLDPNGFPGDRFLRRTSAARKERPILQCTGEPRLFEMGFGSETQNLASAWTGHSSRGYEMQLPIVLVYPDDEDWRRSAWDDADQIALDLRQNYSAAPAGVEIRHISQEIEPQIIEHDEDPWFYLVLTLYALVRVDAASESGGGEQQQVYQ